MSGCERSWSGYSHYVHSSQYYHSDWTTAVDYCGVPQQSPTAQTNHYLPYNEANCYVGAVFPSCHTHYWDGDNLVDAYGRVVKRRTSANKKERRRTQSINNAFTDLRECIPNVPADTKLSKIKTLRLATSYIAYLMGVLRRGSSDTPKDFKAVLPPRKKNSSESKKISSENEAESCSSSSSSPVQSSSPLSPGAALPEIRQSSTVTAPSFSTASTEHSCFITSPHPIASAIHYTTNIQAAVPSLTQSYLTNQPFQNGWITSAGPEEMSY